MKELKEQFKNLLDKDFIQLSVTLGLSILIFEEEGWFPYDIYRLPSVEQGNDQEHIFSSKDLWYFLSALGCFMFLENLPYIRIPSVQSYGMLSSKDRIHDPLWSLLVLSHVLWFRYHTSSVHGLMNRVLKPYLDMFVMVLIDDILRYSWNEEDPINHLQIGL